MDGKMSRTRTWKSRLAVVICLACLVAVGTLAARKGWQSWRKPAADVLLEFDVDLEVESLLAETDSTRVREWVKAMMNPGSSIESVAQLREHFEQLIELESPSAPLSMIYYVECLAPRFASLDTQTRLLNLTLLAEVFGWFGQNLVSCWPALLSPSKNVLQAAMAEGKCSATGKGGAVGSADVSLHALQMVRASWLWSPPEVTAATERKSLGTWKADLHKCCAELLASGDDEIRAAAGVAVVSVPIELEAARGLMLLRDESPLVRRSLLMALGERQQLLPSEDVIGFLGDRSASVRTAADLVLANRGLTREQIEMARRVTDPSPVVRAQAPRFIIESTALDRTVWLTHLSRDAEVSVRSEAARALATIGGDECLARLDEMAEADPAAEVRDLARQLTRRDSRKSRPSPRDTANSTPETLPAITTPRAN